MAELSKLDEYWKNFLIKNNRDEDEKCSGDLTFDGKCFENAQINSIVLAGQKTAFFTSWSTYAIDQEPVPVSGELYLVLDRNEKPVCVIETQSVQVIPFNEVTWEMAKLEGEDENLEVWREKKREYLEEWLSVFS